MSFNSIIFILFFLPAMLFFYYTIKDQYKNLTLLIGSVLFLLWAGTKPFLILLTALTINYIVGLLLNNLKSKKIILTFGILLNISFLIFYKYSNFFIDSYNKYLSTGKDISLLNIIVPLGISYITFQQISYIVDIYLEKIENKVSYLDYALYILYFPKIIAGPITNYQQINTSLKEKKYSDYRFNYGIYRFTIGLSKKVIIASTLQDFVDKTFSVSPFNLGTALCWIAMIAYSLQIYFDFSGYTDMALGISEMFLFKLPENFNKPYSASSINDFWKRWHISLTSFLRNYIYIPLGGNRKGKKRALLNTFIVFIISGFWHGANFTFLLWGAYHGILIIIEKLGFEKILNKFSKVITIPFVFLLVSIGWVFFRADNISYALSLIKNLFIFNAGSSSIELSFKFILILIIGLIICMLPSITQLNNIFNPILNTKKVTISMKITSLLLFIYSLGIIASGSFKPFIYFNF